MGQAAVDGKKGFKVWKWLGVLAVIGVAVAIGRIVLRVFREENARRANTDQASGV